MEREIERGTVGQAAPTIKRATSISNKGFVLV